MWDRKDVVLITGENSAFIWDERLFSNINSKEIITTKAIDAFSEFDNILKNIKEKFKPQDNKLFLLSLGLTATVLAYELAKLGYQALDIGHVSVNYLSSIGEIENIEVLRKTGKFADGKIDIKKVLKKS